MHCSVFLINDVGKIVTSIVNLERNQYPFSFFILHFVFCFFNHVLPSVPSPINVSNSNSQYLFHFQIFGISVFLNKTSIRVQDIIVSYISLSSQKKVKLGKEIFSNEGYSHTTLVVIRDRSLSVIRNPKFSLKIALTQ